eukprot:SAG11_NODE_1741_length_4336_cov_1.517583_3_plen_106_part_00
MTRPSPVRALTQDARAKHAWAHTSSSFGVQFIRWQGGGMPPSRDFKSAGLTHSVLEVRSLYSEQPLSCGREHVAKHSHADDDVHTNEDLCNRQDMEVRIKMYGRV